MSGRPSAAAETALRLWHRTDARGTAGDDVAARAAHLCTQLDSGLSRWVGTVGYHVILDRALSLTRPAHPALTNVSCRIDDTASLESAIRDHGAQPVAAGMIALLESLIDVLGRIIGEDLATHLIDGIGAAGRESAASDTKGGSNG